MILPAGLQGEPAHCVPPQDGLLGGEPHQAVLHPQCRAGEVNRAQLSGGAGSIAPVKLEALSYQLGSTGRVWDIIYYFTLEGK